MSRVSLQSATRSQIGRSHRHPNAGLNARMRGRRASGRIALSAMVAPSDKKMFRGSQSASLSS